MPEETMKRSITLLAAALAALLLLAACSGGGAATTTTTATTTAGGSSTSTAAGGEFQVVIDSFAFTPAELTVPVGATVTWVNHQGARHDVVAADGTFTSPLFGEGETFSFTFTAPGEYPYVCSIHSGMDGTIIVTP
jgi:plastocyanin